jgi:hypothetical protein
MVQIMKLFIMQFWWPRRPSSSLSPNVFLSILFLNTLTLCTVCSSLKVRGQTTGNSKKIIEIELEMIFYEKIKLVALD